MRPYGLLELFRGKWSRCILRRWTRARFASSRPNFLTGRQPASFLSDYRVQGSPLPGAWGEKPHIQSYFHARPYTGMTAPDVTRQSSEHRYAIVLAISAGFTQFSCFAFGIATRFASVSIVLGAIALTITPSSSTSCASDAVKVAIAPFATAYAA